MRYSTCLAAVLFSGLLVSETVVASSCAPEAVYLLRHAEKEKSPGNRDPQLSPQGMARAAALAEKLNVTAIDAIYATEYQRTQQTVTPLAQAKKLSVVVKPAREIDALAADFLKACDQTLVYAGHSNTVPKMIEALGGRFEVSINGQSLALSPVVYLDEGDYGTLFKLSYGQSGAATVKLSKF